MYVTFKDKYEIIILDTHQIHSFIYDFSLF